MKMQDLAHYSLTHEYATGTLVAAVEQRKRYNYDSNFDKLFTFFFASERVDGVERR